jgi:hypothetical protein
MMRAPETIIARLRCKLCGTVFDVTDGEIAAQKAVVRVPRIPERCRRCRREARERKQAQQATADRTRWEVYVRGFARRTIGPSMFPASGARTRPEVAPPVREMKFSK